MSRVATILMLVLARAVAVMISSSKKVLEVKCLSVADPRLSLLSLLVADPGCRWSLLCPL